MKKLHMIGNAHLDPVWLWTWQEGFHENKATFQSALQRLKEYEDVVFTSSSAQFYEWVEQHDPVMFEEIAKRIKQGRWIICGGWWIQPDCNTPCGESFARHALLSQNYFLKKFSVTAQVGYNVDSFGHHGMLPQILKLSGMDHYVFMRPGPHEKGLPARNFIWESDDGSQVHAFQIPFSYATFGDLAAHIDACVGDFDPNVQEFMCFYGVGNHGGGPTVQNIETIKSVQNRYQDVEIIFSNPNDYFCELKSKNYSLPVVHGDLQHHASGCYSVQSQVKTMNRRSENALLKAEKFSSLSTAMGKSNYPKTFPTAWKRVLFNQFHDILAGTSIPQAYEDTRNQHGEALSIAAANENDAVQAISFSIGIEQQDGMLPVVAFNPHSWDIVAPIEIEIGHFENMNASDNYKVVDSEGKELCCQRISAHAKVNGRIRIVFRGHIPALGYATFRVYAIKQNEEYYSKSASNVLENEWIRVKIDGQTGGLSSVYQKDTDTELLKGIGALPVIMEDHSDTWSHDVIRFDQKVGSFTPVSIKKVEDGSVRASIRVISRYQSSVLVQTFTLYHNSSDIHVTSRINWQEKFKCLKLQFPLQLEQYRATYEIPFGSIVKECNGEEESMQKWIDLSGMKDDKSICGLSILNNNKCSGSVERNVMAVTVLRSPVYAHHNPHILDDEIENYQFIDQGIQEFSYVIVPHTGTWKEGNVVQKAYEFNQPYTAIVETYHKGDLAQKAGFIQIDCPNVVLSAFKKAEDKEMFIVRIYELFGQKTKTTIDLPLFGKQIVTEINPYEIKSFAVDAQADSKPLEVNLLEWNLDS